MSLSTQDSDEDSQYVLVAKMDSARNMTTILKAIHFKDVGSRGRAILCRDSRRIGIAINVETLSLAVLTPNVL